MSKQFIVVLAVVVLGLFGIFGLTKKSSNDNQSSATNAQLSRHAQGAGKKGVTLVEYGDLQCPVCKQFYPILKQVQETYGDDITFQFRNYPIVQIHPHAFEAARVAEAAGKQDKFWEMHDLLYENQDSWAQAQDVNAVFELYAKQLGLDIDKFRADVNSEQTAATINADVRSAQDIGATGTPTFLLNGKKLDPNPQSFGEFKKLIDEAIKQSGKQ